MEKYLVVPIESSYLSGKQLIATILLRFNVDERKRFVLGTYEWIDYPWLTAQDDKALEYIKAKLPEYELLQVHSACDK